MSLKKYDQEIMRNASESGAWNGLSPQLQLKLEIELCHVELRGTIYTELVKKEGGKGKVNFIGRVLDRVIKFIHREVPEAKFQQKDLAIVLGLSNKNFTAISKLLSGGVSGGDKKGLPEKVEWPKKCRELLDFLVAGKKPEALANGDDSPAKRIDYYYFRGDDDVAVWSDERRGSIHAWSPTEFASEITRCARIRQFDPSAKVEVFFVFGGRPFRFDDGEDLITESMVECARSGVGLQFFYLKPTDEVGDTEASIRRLLERLGNQVSDARARPIRQKDLTLSTFITPATNYVWLNISGKGNLWIVRPDTSEADTKTNIPEPYALRGRERERQAFEKWLNEFGPSTPLESDRSHLERVTEPTSTEELEKLIEPLKPDIRRRQRNRRAF